MSGQKSLACKLGGLDPGYGWVSRSIQVGSLGKPDLLAELRRRGVELNEAAETLFAHPAFTTTAGPSSIDTVEVPVGALGFRQGATMERIHQRATELGLALCPLELGPYLRLRLVDQPEGSLGYPPSRNRAPPGSITVASRPIADDDETPKGFYLRRIRGVLWLRGYRSDAEHVWDPDDRLVFCCASDPF